MGADASIEDAESGGRGPRATLAEVEADARGNGIRRWATRGEQLAARERPPRGARDRGAARRDMRAIARFEAELTRLLDTEFALIAGQGGGAEEAARLAEAFELAARRGPAPPTRRRSAADEAQREAREAEAAVPSAPSSRRRCGRSGSRRKSAR